MTTPDLLALTPEQLAVSPGAGAFFIFFILAIAIVLLVMNMSKHLRKVDRHRIEAEVRAELAAERAAAEEAAQEESAPEDSVGEGPGGPVDEA